jgi:hypothetical protein
MAEKKGTFYFVNQQIAILSFLSGSPLRQMAHFER